MSRMVPREGRVADSTYTAYDQGAHLATWSVGGTQVVWLSPRAGYAEGKSLRGGIPVCWPWFAAGPDGSRTPSHGFVRTAQWDLLAHDQGAARDQLVWELTGDGTRGLPGADTFPDHFLLRLTAEIGQDLAVTLEVTNTGEEPFSFEAALHTYLHVGDVRQVRLSGLAGTDYFDKVTGQPGHQEGDLRLSGETDRIYACSAVVEVDDPVLDRRLRVTPVGSTDTVVWNPWADKGAELPDVGEEWPRMLCVESAIVGDNAIRLAAGQEHHLTTRIELTGGGEL